MREKKIFYNKSILLFLICLTFSYILFKSSPKFPEKKFRKKENRKTRKLIDSQKVYEICKNSPKEVFNFYYNNSEFKLSEKIEYKDNEEYIQNIITMLDEKKKDSKKIKKYIVHILPYFFLLIITFLVPIFWIGCFFCFYCNWLCCCGYYQNNIGKNLFYLITIIFLLIGMIFAMLGLNRYEDVFISLNGVTCSLMQFVLELSDGQKKEEKPKWDGINNIKDILTNTISSIKNSKGQIFNEFESQMNDLDDEIDSWYKKLDDIYEEVKKNYYSFEVDFNGSINHFYPEYILSYGPALEPNKILFASTLEFFNIYYYLKSTLSEFKTIIDDNIVINDLENAKNKLDDLLSQFNNFTDSIVDPWYDYQDKVVKYGKKASIFFFYYIIIENFLLMIFFTINVCMNKGIIFKIIIHFLWMTLGILIIVNMLLGSILTILGVVGKDFVSVLHFIVSSDNLKYEHPKIFSNGESLKYINTCMNGNGDLSSAFNFDIITLSLNEIISLRNYFIMSKNEIKDLKESNTISQYENYLNIYKEKYLSDIYYIQETQIGDVEHLFNVNTIIKELNDYSINQINNDNCILIKDLYSVNNSNSYYTLISPSDPTHNLGSDSLIYLYDDWTDSLIEKRYENENICEDKNNKNIKDIASNYMKFFNNIKEKNNNLISNIQSFNKELNEKFKNIIENLKQSINSCNKIIDPIFEVFNNIIGDSNNIFSIMNCKFLSSDIKVTFTEIYIGLGKDIHNYGLLIFIIGVSEGFSIFGILIAMNLHKIIEDKKDKEKGIVISKNNINNNTEKDDSKIEKKNNDQQSNDSNMKLILNDNKKMF